MLTNTNHKNILSDKIPFPKNEVGEDMLAPMDGDPAFSLHGGVASPSALPVPGLPRRPAFLMASVQYDPSVEKSSSGSRSSLLSDVHGESVSTVVASSITESSVSINSQEPEHETILSTSTVDLTEDDHEERPRTAPACRRPANLRIDVLSAENDDRAVRLQQAAARPISERAASLPSTSAQCSPAAIAVWPHLPVDPTSAQPPSSSSSSVGSKQKRKKSPEEELGAISDEATAKKASKPKPVRSSSSAAIAMGGSSDGSGVGGADHFAAGDDDELQAVHGPWADIYAKVKLFVCMTPRNLANSDVMIRYANEDFFTNFGFDKASTLPLPLKTLFGHGSSRLVLHKLHMALLSGKQAYEFINLYRADKRPLACHLVLVSITGNRHKSPDIPIAAGHSSMGHSAMAGFGAASSSAATSTSTSTSRPLPPEVAAQYEEKYAILTIRSASVIGNAKSYGIGFFGPGRIVSIQRQVKPPPPTAPIDFQASSAPPAVDGEKPASRETRQPAGGFNGVQRIRHSTISGRGESTSTSESNGDSLLQYHHQAHGAHRVSSMGYDNATTNGSNGSSTTMYRSGAVRRVSAASAELVGPVTGVAEFVQSSLSDRLARSTLSMQEAAMIRDFRGTVAPAASSTVTRLFPCPSGAADRAATQASLDTVVTAPNGDSSGDHKRRKLSASTSLSSSSSPPVRYDP